MTTNDSRIKKAVQAITKEIFFRSSGRQVHNTIVNTMVSQPLLDAISVAP